MLRAVAIFFFLLWSNLVQAQDLLMQRTLLLHDSAFGSQVIYLGRSGKTFLWHPSSDQVIGGRWSTRSSGSYPDTICLRYGGSEYNPVTGQGDQCTHVTALLAKTVEQADGDYFLLSDRKEVPFPLSARRTSIEALATKSGIATAPDIVETPGLIRPGEPLPDMGFLCEQYADNETIRLYSFCANP